MNEKIEQLIELMMSKNNTLTYEQATTWVELLWSDFESTYAKAGWDYQGAEMTEKVVRQWIMNYADQLHEFVARNPKYRKYLDEEGTTSVN